MFRILTRRKFHTIAVFGVGAALMVGTTGAAAAAPAGVASMSVSAASAGATGDAHFVAYRTDPDQRNGKALLFLGGSAGPAGGYQDITEHAASLGFDAIDLAYPNTQILGVSCKNNGSCFENARGETIFGRNVVHDAQVGRGWQSNIVNISAANSVVGRTVGLLDHLQTGDGRWGDYLVDDPTSPYATPHHNAGVRPDWSRIVVSGHSQGGGNAAFLGVQVPVARVALFSAPNDNVNGTPASWITRPSRTPLANYWGLRHNNEGPYGEFTGNNWDKLGGVDANGVGLGGVGGPGHNTPAPVDDGSKPSGGSHRLVITSPDTTTLHNHNSTALDSAAGAEVRPAWSTLLIGTGTG